MIVIDTTPDILARIHEPGIGMAVWERGRDLKFAEWLNDLPPDQLPDGRVLVDGSGARGALKSIFHISGTPDRPQRQIFEEDVLFLARKFIQLAEVPMLDIRLEKVTGDACWKFHVDVVPFRMLTTYRGQTTQWISRENEAKAKKQQRNYSGPLNHLPPSSVAVFKGSQSEDASGVLHRSPPINGSGETRLLLCLNVPSDASPEPWRKM